MTHEKLNHLNFFRDEASALFREGRNSLKDSDYGGVRYAIAALGARMAREGTVKQWEIDTLIAKAKSLKDYSNPELTVMEGIENWKHELSTQ